MQLFCHICDAGKQNIRQICYFPKHPSSAEQGGCTYSNDLQVQRQVLLSRDIPGLRNLQITMTTNRRLPHQADCEQQVWKHSSRDNTQVERRKTSRMIVIARFKRTRHCQLVQARMWRRLTLPSSALRTCFHGSPHAATNTKTKVPGKIAHNPQPLML